MTIHLNAIVAMVYLGQCVDWMSTVVKVKALDQENG